VTGKLETQENQIQELRARIVELREMLHLYSGTASEGFIREHIRQLQKRVQYLLTEAAATHAVSPFNATTGFQES
jgi:hypothetical protein